LRVIPADTAQTKAKNQTKTSNIQTKTTAKAFSNITTARLRSKK